MYLSIIRSFMSININITFMNISRLILASKSTPFTFFTWIFAYIITFFHRRFVYIHTFFHRKIMCSFRLATCLYDILQTSYERRLHRSRVAPSVPIWAEFASTLGKYIPTDDSSRHEPTELSQPFAPGDPIIYTYIFAGKNGDAVIRTRAHEKIRLDFSRAKPLYVLYIAGKNVKKCKVRSCLCALDPSIFHFIWAKHCGKIW